MRLMLRLTTHIAGLRLVLVATYIAPLHIRPTNNEEDVNLRTVFVICVFLLNLLTRLLQLIP